MEKNILVAIKDGKVSRKEYKTMSGMQKGAIRAIKEDADVIIKQNAYGIVSIYNSRTGMFVKA